MRHGNLLCVERGGEEERKDIQSQGTDLGNQLLDGHVVWTRIAKKRVQAWGRQHSTRKNSFHMDAHLGFSTMLKA